MYTYTDIQGTDEYMYSYNINIDKYSIYTQNYVPQIIIQSRTFLIKI